MIAFFIKARCTLITVTVISLIIHAYYPFGQWVSVSPNGTGKFFSLVNFLLTYEVFNIGVYLLFVLVLIALLLSFAGLIFKKNTQLFEDRNSLMHCLFTHWGCFQRNW